MKKFKTAVRFLLIVLAGAVLGVNVYLWNARTLTGNVLPMPMGVGAAMVLTGSMEPTISPDDLIVVAEQESYDVDDIVVYQSVSMLVVHRIIDMDEETVTTKGDANNTTDEPVKRSAIKGEVVAVIPMLGTVFKLLKTPTATIVLLALAVCMMEVSFRKEKEQGDDELEKIKEEIRKLKEEQKQTT